VLSEIVHPGDFCAFGGIPGIVMDLNNFSKMLKVVLKLLKLLKQDLAARSAAIILLLLNY
jgi:hypothetical protein